MARLCVGGEIMRAPVASCVGFGYAKSAWFVMIMMKKKKCCLCSVVCFGDRPCVICFSLVDSRHW